MKRLTNQEIDERDARDLLEDAVAMSAALLDSVAAMLEIRGTEEGQLFLSPKTASGIRQLAEEQSSNLRNRFQELCDAGRARAAEVTAAPIQTEIVDHFHGGSTG